MENIKLNFVALLDQARTYTVYRKAVNDSAQSKQEDDYRTNLPQDSASETDYSLYDVSLTEKDGYAAFECTYSTNLPLAEYYLYELLKRGLSENWEGCQYEGADSKYKEIRFITEQHEKGNTEICLYPYFLRSEGKLGFVVEHRFSKKADVPFDREIQKLSKSLDSAGKQNIFFYRDKELEIKNFIIERLLPFSKKSSMEISSEFLHLPTKELDKKIYIVANNKTSNSQFMGVRNYGPYKELEDNVHYLFAFSEKTRSLARDVYMGLYGKLFPGQFAGMAQMFGLPFGKDNVSHHVVPTFDKSSIDALQDKVEEIKKDHPNTKVMMVVVLPEGFKGVESAFDAYGYLKLFSLKNSVYCQVTTEDTLSKRDQLKWSISNIGLQIFSKLGGVPWLVKPAKNNCLILGIGSAHERSDGETKKYVAYTVCLDSSGDFKYIKPLSSSENEQTYISDLKQSLKETLQEEIAKEYTSFVLHIPYKIKKDEIEAIRATIEEVKQGSECEFIVLKINTQHRFLGFSEHNTRVPYESSLLQLSSSQFLLWAEGLQYGKEVLHKRVSEPLLIDFQEDYKWDDKRACLQDVLNLTGANWRGFNSKAQPISILYAKLIAKFMKEFAYFEECDDPSLLQAESTAPWFL